MNRRQRPPKSGRSCFLPDCLPCLPSFAALAVPLFNCAVAGFQYYDGLRCIPTIRPGDRLDLVREPDNPHDEKAIAVYAPMTVNLVICPGI